MKKPFANKRPLVDLDFSGINDECSMYVVLETKTDERLTPEQLNEIELELDVTIGYRGRGRKFGGPHKLTRNSVYSTKHKGSVNTVVSWESDRNDLNSGDIKGAENNIEEFDYLSNSDLFPKIKVYCGEPQETKLIPQGMSMSEI
jgi:hypothetical protein